MSDLLAAVKWEYAIRYADRRPSAAIAGMLDGLGSDGWGLVSVTQVRVDDTLCPNVQYVFKRRKT